MGAERDVVKVDAAAPVFGMGYARHAGPDANAGFSFIYELYCKLDTKRAIT